MILSSLPIHEHLPQPPLPNRRKRGGQRGNSNARKHGYFSPSKKPADIAFLAGFVSAEQVRKQYQCNPNPSILHSALQKDNVVLLKAFARTSLPPPAPKSLFWFKKVLRISRVSCKLELWIFEAEGRQSHLQSLASNMDLLVNYEFVKRRIAPHPLFISAAEQFFPMQKVFVSTGLGNFRTNSPSKTVTPILPTDDQWRIISPAIHSLDQQNAQLRTYKRHIPDHDPRLLMQGILLKLAFDIKWNEVPKLVSTLSPKAPPYPVRAAQKLYRDLYNSGLLRTLYEKLLEHLNTYAEKPLEKLVEQRCFHMKKGKTVTFAPRETLNWEKLTALLFLQRARRALMLIEREETSRRRQRGQFLRLPSLRLKKPKIDQPAALPPTPPQKSEPEFIPLEKSTAGQKWKAIETTSQIIAEQTRRLLSRRPEK